MKNIGAMQSKFGSEALRGWLIGTGCGVLLTIGVATGSGRLLASHTQNTQPVVVVAHAPMIRGEGAVPPPIDEFQQYYVFQPAILNNAELVPPIVEIRQSRLSQQALGSDAGLVPPPTDEIKQLHHVESPDETGAGRPAPSMPGTSEY